MMPKIYKNQTIIFKAVTENFFDEYKNYRQRPGVAAYRTSTSNSPIYLGTGKNYREAYAKARRELDNPNFMRW